MVYIITKPAEAEAECIIQKFRLSVFFITSWDKSGFNPEKKVQTFWLKKTSKI
jgi:hypothetical protein